MSNLNAIEIQKHMDNGLTWEDLPLVIRRALIDKMYPPTEENEVLWKFRNGEEPEEEAHPDDGIISACCGWEIYNGFCSNCHEHA